MMFLNNSYLIQLIIRSFIFCCEVKEELLDVPIEQWIEICLQIKCEEAQIILLLARRVVRNILDYYFDCVNICMYLVLVEEGGEETEECETS